MAKRLVLFLAVLTAACSGSGDPVAEAAATSAASAAANDAAAATAPLASISTDAPLAKSGRQPIALPRPQAAAAEKRATKSGADDFSKDPASEAAASNAAPTVLRDQSGSASKPH